jgi:hypothetical protein
LGRDSARQLFPRHGIGGLIGVATILIGANVAAATGAWLAAAGNRGFRGDRTVK